MPPDEEERRPVADDYQTARGDQADSAISTDRSAAGQVAKGPYAAVAVDYLHAGWTGVLPIPAGQKSPPPDGYTGWNGVDPSYPDVYAWTEDRPGDNVALRLPDGVLGVDVDCYGGKPGALTVDRREAEWGPLPATWTIVNRTDGSGTRLFGVPPGLAWVGGLPGVDLIHSGHRYAMAPPSTHPEGRLYRWVGPDGQSTDTMPKPDELPDLPDTWVRGLSRGNHIEVHRAGLTAAEAYQALIDLPHAGEEPCQFMRAEADKIIAAIGTGSGRHDTVRDRVLAMVRWAEGDLHAGLIGALASVRESFLSRVIADRTRKEAKAEAEWDRILDGAVAIVTDDPTFIPGFAKRERCLCVGRDGSAEAGFPVAGRSGAAPDAEVATPHRRLVLTSAADIQPRRVRWLWEGRMAVGMLSLLAGPEGLGKSTLAYWLAAQVTRGKLPGEYSGRPRSVLVCATEDTWEEIIVPRLIAVGADRTRVFRVEVLAPDDIHLGLELPADLDGVANAAEKTGASLLLLDPLTSRLAAAIDSHKDAEVRRALEPLAKTLSATGLCGIGLIHLNKSNNTNVLDRVMASKAFTAVARSVSVVLPDPDDEDGRRRIFGTPKNNAGRSGRDLPTLGFTIEEATVETDDGPTMTGVVRWGDASDLTIDEAMHQISNGGADPSSSLQEAMDWLSDTMEREGRERSAVIKDAAKRAGISEATLKRAKRKLGVRHQSEGFPRVTWWYQKGYLEAKGE